MNRRMIHFAESILYKDPFKYEHRVIDSFNALNHFPLIGRVV